MTLTLYFHPLASFCWKALIALYENDTPFTPKIVDLGDPASRAAFLKVWPIGKFPVLRDDARDQTIPESTIIIEYLAQHYPGASALIPADPDRVRDVRLADRFYDFYVHEQMQKAVGDRLRPKDKKDPFGVAQAKAQIETSYGLIERDMAARSWAAGDTFTMADCAAAPALYYANRVHPIGTAHRHIGAYLARLMQRLSFARVLAEAQPYFKMFPE